MSSRFGINQEIIITKALEIADREGMEAVTMANIARELTIKSPSLYNHFKGLNDIKQTMANKAQKLLYLHLKEAIQNKQEGLDTIQGFGKAYLTFSNQFPGHYEASLTALDPSSQNVNFFGESIIDLTKESLSLYRLNQNEIIHVIRGLRSLLHGIVDLERKGGFNIQLNLGDSLEMILETFVNGVGRQNQELES